MKNFSPLKKILTIGLSIGFGGCAVYPDNYSNYNNGQYYSNMPGETNIIIQRSEPLFIDYGPRYNCYPRTCRTPIPYPSRPYPNYPNRPNSPNDPRHDNNGNNGQPHVYHPSSNPSSPPSYKRDRDN